jgi:hypothetical protein
MNLDYPTVKPVGLAIRLHHSRDQAEGASLPLAHGRRVLMAANKAAHWGTSAIAAGRRVITDGSAP